jgi:methionyl-tRNA formyltransferase
VRTVLVGNRELARQVLRHILERDWSVVGAVAAAGEAARQQARHSSFADLATEHDFELVETEDINDESTREALSALDPDICLCPGWHQIIEEAVLDIPTQGFIGFHSARLPEGRGGAPVNWSIIRGEEQVWLSMFYYTPGIDDGPVIDQRSIPIEERDDVDTVFDRLTIAACDILDANRPGLHDGPLETTEQSLDRATYRPRRHPQDGLVDWSRPASTLFDWVRAQTKPYPGAYTFCPGGKLVIWEASPVDHKGPRDDTDPDPGEIVAISEGEGVDVATGGGFLRVERVQVDDRPAMWADDFAERFDLEPGDTLGVDHAPQKWLYTGIRDAQGETEYETNLAVGESGTLLAVVRVPNGERVVDVAAWLDNDQLISESRVVSGQIDIPVTYTPDASGTRTITVEFWDSDEELLDRRYLKVFVHGS